MLVTRLHKSQPAEYKFRLALLSVILVIPLLEKALLPIEVTLFGMVILVRPLQDSKALFPIEVTLFGMVILVSELQLLKAPVPIEVTPSGIVMLVTLEHL